MATPILIQRAAEVIERADVEWQRGDWQNEPFHEFAARALAVAGLLCEDDQR